MNFSLQKNGRKKFRQKQRVIQGHRVIEGRVIEGFYCTNTNRVKLNISDSLTIFP